MNVSRAKVLPVLYGFFGTLACVILIAVCYSGWVLWHRAANGEAAFEYIQRVVAQQQQAQQAPAHPPTK